MNAQPDAPASWLAGLLPSVRFEQPVWLWLIGVGALTGLIGWLLLRRLHWLRRHGALLARVALMGVLAMVLAEATSVRRTDQAALIAVLDTSGSVQSFVPPVRVAPAPGAPVDAPTTERPALEHVRALLARAGASRGPDDLLGVVTADAGARVVMAPRGAQGAGGDAQQIERVSISAQGPEGTDLGAALRLAGAAIPASAVGRVLLVSDGNQTAGDALAVADALPKGVPIDVLALDYDLASEVLVESVEAPTRAAAGSVAQVRVTLLATSPARGTLRVLREGQEVDISPGAEGLGRAVELSAGRTTLSALVPLAGGRVHRLEAVWEPARSEAGAPEGDTVLANNRGLAVTTTPGSGAVLLVDGVGRASADSPGRELARALSAQGFAVTVLPPEGIPASVLGLAAFDLVILQNVPADAVPAGTQQLLARHVADFGAGLLMTGGPDSFGAGGWRASEIESILPVTLDLPDRLVTPSLALVIILDSSGSMARPVLSSGRSQQQIANYAAAKAIESLSESDLVGVIRFDNESRWVVNLEKHTQGARTRDAVLGISPSGGTNLPPALDMAIGALEPVKAASKHIVVLSDGQSQGRERLAAQAARARGLGMKITTIAVGDQADADGLERLAQGGGGEFYNVVDPDILPRVFLRAVRVVRTPLIREEPFVPVVADTSSPLVAGVATGAGVPRLLGLTLTQAKQLGAPGAQRAAPGVTYAMLTPQGEPLLAHWAVGLGQVGAFTSDAHKWAEPWRAPGAWGAGAGTGDGYARFWGQLARALGRPAGEQLADLGLRVENGELKVRLEVVDAQGKPVDGLRVPATVFGPRAGEGGGGGEQPADSDRVDVRLAQTGPGVYEGVAPAPVQGTYVVLASPGRAELGAGDAPGPRLPPVVGGAVRPPGDEFRRLRSSPELLAELARRTGGRVLTMDQLGAMDARTLFARDRVEPKLARTPLWPWLLPLAVALLLVDVALRRIAWERLWDGGAGEAALGGVVVARWSDRAARKRQAREQSPAPAPTRAKPVEPPARTPRRTPAPASPPAPTSTAAPGAPGEPDTGGLLAAKRRAQRQMGER